VIDIPVSLFLICTFFAILVEKSLSTSYNCWNEFFEIAFKKQVFVKMPDEKSNSGKMIPYKALIMLMRLLGIGIILLLVIFLLPFAVPYIKNAVSYGYIKTALQYEKSISSFIHSLIPTTIAGKDMTRWIVIASAVMLGLSFENITNYCKNRIYTLNFRKEYEDWKSEHHLPDGAKVLAPIREKIENISTPTKSEREELLKLFAETKKKLDTMGRDLAFLSIDVIDSTGLKEEEEKAIIEYDFKEYKKYAESKLAENGVIKATWTPDGVMCCFSTVDAAVKAARALIDGLEAFNKHVKTLKKDFRVRCGINSGYVYFDESVPLEEISDHVIDVAGHMQKQAAPNSIFIAKNIIKPLQEPSHFIPISKVVDGYEVYMLERRKTPRE
jgi:class 3 adenylate cyclase